MSKLLKTGIAGTIITAICCFTPLLVWAFPAIGLAAALPWLDTILLPLLGLFIALMLYAFVSQAKT